MASDRDAPAIVGLINAAYLVEAHFARGDRIEIGEVLEMMARPDSAFILLEARSAGAGDRIAGVAYVYARPPRGYFGPLAVDPNSQRLGHGRTLIREAERRCADAGCTSIELTVATPRTELVEYYSALGYATIGSEPFPKPHRLLRDASLLVMSKRLGAPAREGR
jgi:ribosomal protein S18 acetylase RimI-like enzyme